MSKPQHTTGASRQRRSLVTGGAGFIGSHLVDRLLTRGDRVCVVDDLSTGNAENLASADGDRLEFIRARVGDACSSGALTGPFDRVFHLAASVGVGLVMDKTAEAIDNNVHETSALLRWCAENGSPRTLIASSSEVYGRPQRDVFSEEDDTVYGPTTVARWSYAMSKALDEHLALSFARTGAVPTICARLFNTVGPRQVGRYGMVLPRFVDAALSGLDLPVHGDGTQSRCFCDVRDVVAALDALIESPSAIGRVFNVGADTPITILELAHAVICETRSASAVRLIPYAQAYPEGFEDLQRRRPDLSRLRAEIGFASRITLIETIRDIATEKRAAACVAAAR